MCNYVEKDTDYATQPDGSIYDYYFDEYTYDTAYDVVQSRLDTVLDFTRLKWFT